MDNPELVAKGMDIIDADTSRKKMVFQFIDKQSVFNNAEGIGISITIAFLSLAAKMDPYDCILHLFDLEDEGLDLQRNMTGFIRKDGFICIRYQNQGIEYYYPCHQMPIEEQILPQPSRDPIFKDKYVQTDPEDRITLQLESNPLKLSTCTKKGVGIWKEFKWTNEPPKTESKYNNLGNGKSQFSSKLNVIIGAKRKRKPAITDAELAKEWVVRK